MALSPVSLTLKQKIFVNSKNLFLQERRKDQHAPIYGVWKEFCRRCGCLEADGRHFERLLH
jgi:hypothetical protein